MTTYFNEVQNNFGFGCMRLPMNGSEVDFAEFSKMIAQFFAAGFTYFDTAHGYLNGKRRAGGAICVEELMEEFDSWKEIMRRAFYKEEYL